MKKRVSKINEHQISRYGEVIYNDEMGKTYLEEGDACLNKDGIKIGDVFWTRYRDINILFQVSKTRSHSVAIYEIETVIERCYDAPNELYELIPRKIEPKKKPLIITNHNTFKDTQFWVASNYKGRLSIPTSIFSPICQLDTIRGRTPRVTKLIGLNLKKLLGKDFPSIYEFPVGISRLPDWPKDDESIDKTSILA